MKFFRRPFDDGRLELAYHLSIANIPQQLENMAVEPLPSPEKSGSGVLLVLRIESELQPAV